MGQIMGEGLGGGWEGLDGAGRGWKGLGGAGRGWEGLGGAGRGWEGLEEAGRGWEGLGYIIKTKNRGGTVVGWVGGGGWGHPLHPPMAMYDFQVSCRRATRFLSLVVSDPKQCSVFLIPINKRRRWKLVLSLTDGALYCS
jgi:hypothetical protein